MALGNAGIYLAGVLALVGILVTVLGIVSKDRRLEGLAKLASLGLFGVVTVLMVYLYYLFLTADVSYEYVFLYTAKDAALKYKLSGVLAGKAGSLLFWIWMITIPWTIEEFRRDRSVDPAVKGWTRIGVLATSVVLLWVLAINDLFTATPSSWLASEPGGQGLNALLQTDLMVIHPPVVFVAYGLMVLPLAAGFAHLVTGNRDWVKVSMLWSRVGWLFLTIGIAIGGVWAYTTLGWGGYWGWDPVETSSLLPWLLLTGFLHAQLMFKRKGDYAVSAPLLGILSFVLVVFATFATRAAGLWVSVHTFGAADTNVPAWDRLVDLMTNDHSVVILVVYIIMASVWAFALAAWRYAIRPRKEEQYLTVSELIDDGMLMFITVAMFAFTTFVTLLILVGGVNGLSAENFNTPVGLLSLVGMLVLLLCLVWRDLGRRRVAQLAGAALLVGVVAGLLLEDRLAGFAIPILLVSLVGAAYKVVRSFDRARPLPSLGLVGAHLIHLSVVLILIGYVGSTLLPNESDMSLRLDGQSQEFGGYDFKFTDVDYSNDDEAGYAFAEVEVMRSGDLVERARPGVQMVNGQVRSEVAVVNLATEDLYLVYHSINGSGASTTLNMSVKILPLMSVLWSGMVLMWVGIVVRMAAEPLAKRRRATRTAASTEATAGRRRPPRRSRPPEAEPDEDEEAEEGDAVAEDSYYEDLLEEELKRIK